MAQKITRLRGPTPAEGGVYVETVVITPEMALEFLEHNEANRSVRQMWVDTLTRDILAGDFYLSNDAVIFDEDGKLINGQHRLLACIEADRPITCLVMWNAPRRTQAVMDRQRPRTFADYLRWMGETDVHALGTTVRFTYIWELGLLPWGDLAPSLQELTKWFEANRGIRDSLRAGTAVGKRPYWSRTSAAAFHHRAHSRWPEEVEQFFYRVSSGEDLRTGHPVYAFRRWLENVSDRRMPGRQSVKPVIYTGVAVKAFNAFVQGRTLNHLRYSPSTEDFPKIVGVDT